MLAKEGIASPKSTLFDVQPRYGGLSAGYFPVAPSLTLPADFIGKVAAAPITEFCDGMHGKPLLFVNESSSISGKFVAEVGHMLGGMAQISA